MSFKLAEAFVEVSMRDALFQRGLANVQKGLNATVAVGNRATLQLSNAFNNLAGVIATTMARACYPVSSVGRSSRDTSCCRIERGCPPRASSRHSTEKASSASRLYRSSTRVRLWA